MLASVLLPGPPRSEDVLSYPIAGGDALKLTHTTHAAHWTLRPQVSPDGKRVAYWAGAGVWVVPATGGISHLVARDARSFAWSPDGRLLAVATGDAGIAVVPASGGRARSLGTRSEERRVGKECRL